MAADPTRDPRTWDLAGTRSFLSAASVAASGRPAEELGSERTHRKMLWLEDAAANPDMPAPAFRLLFHLGAKHMNGESGEAWPSVPTLMRELGWQRTAVRDNIKAAVRLGYLGRVPGAGAGHRSAYWPLLPTGFDALLKGSEIRPVEGGTRGRKSDPFHSPRKGRKSGAERVGKPTQNPMKESSEVDDAAEQHHHPASSDWPLMASAHRARALCKLASLQPTPGLLRSAAHWLSKWEREGTTWAAVQLGVLVTAFNAKEPVHSFGYFRAEVENAQAKHVGDEFFDAESTIRHFARLIADRAAALEPAA